MKILLLGANGQVGWELRRSLSTLGEVTACDSLNANLENSNKICKLIHYHNPVFIVNAAAYTNVDRAEIEQEKAYQINSEAVAVLAHEAKKNNSWLIHYSTDYVYDGMKTGAYVETDETNPQSVYGKTKLQGEEGIKNSECNYITFRTSWVYSTSGKNFVKTIIKLAKEREEISVVNDQTGAPTSAALIADITSNCIYKISQQETYTHELAGTYHLTSTGGISWHDFAKFILTEIQKHGEHLKITSEKIIPITTFQHQLMNSQKTAKRPTNSRMNTKKLQEIFGVHLPPWQLHAKLLIKDLYTK
jgi:dTDP-4-dehydrorhamnose reductase